MCNVSYVIIATHEDIKMPDLRNKIIGTSKSTSANMTICNDNPPKASKRNLHVSVIKNRLLTLFCPNSTDVCFAFVFVNGWKSSVLTKPQQHPPSFWITH